MGYLAPKGRRENSNFLTVQVKDMHYCSSHKFWFDQEEQNKLLHFGKPCFYTDKRYNCATAHNSYRQGAIGWWRGRSKKGITLNSAIRRINKTFNLPKGTTVEIQHNCYGVSKKNKRKGFSLGYDFKVKKERMFDPNYQISRPSLFDNFDTDLKAKELTDLLRANGFLVKVYKEEDGITEYAIVYGHGLRAAYTARDQDLFGYTYGIKSVLFDKWDDFDKWSRCSEIDKSLPNQEIVDKLLSCKVEE